MVSGRIASVVTQWGMASGVLLFMLSVWQGFSPISQPSIVVAEGMIASLFWLLSAALPFYFDGVRRSPEIMECFNAIAAGATGGALMASVPGAWNVLMAACSNLL